MADEPDKDNRKYGDAPVSRFWACLFSGSILAPIWTFKMGKTLKWLAVYGAVLGAVFLATVVAMLIEGRGPDALTGALGLSLLAGYYGVTYPFTIYFMWRWTSAFNREHFGHTNYRDWNREQRERDEMLS